VQRTIAVLGPTNTGKTHLAVERMLAHQSGMIGLPLRLLAREIYDRIIKIRNPAEIALITGEERIVPKHARYYVCTVEAMPQDLEVEFLAIDEVQLSADPDRGYIFTNRLLHRRALSETMLLGAETMRPLIERLLPDTNFISRPRFSKLTYVGSKKITRLPPRSAIVAFSADTVYAIAELIRRQRGGAAVVLGALSPRTRNAQVELFQSGEVDFLVATDAIGMGLNMDVNHVAFAATQKFDGAQHRALKPAELAQIAGRAGRHMNDGTFGVTANTEAFDAEIIEQIENHHFEPERVLQWRNHVFDYQSPQALLKGLNQPPDQPSLARNRSSYDVLALESLIKDPEIIAMASSPASLRRLWDVCQLPDYRNLSSNEHAILVGQIYRFLMSDKGVIPQDWLQKELTYTDRTEGDIDTLSNRISHIRTWTYVANRADWLDNPEQWRKQTRAIEDKLSDALHKQLTQRFIDRRTSVLAKRLRQKENLMSSLSDDGALYAEDQYLGRLHGFHFVPDTGDENTDTKVLRTAAFKVITREIEKRAQALIQADDSVLTLVAPDSIFWGEDRVARLEIGDHILKPKLVLIADAQLSGPPREAVKKRLETFITAIIAKDLEPLVKLDAANDISGLARGLAFRLVEDFGILVRDTVADEIRQLDQDARKSLRKYGVRFGAFHIFQPALLKPAAAQMALNLWALKQKADGNEIKTLPELPGQGLTSAPFDNTTPKGFYRIIGFRICGKRCVRIDMLERLADLIRPRIFWKSEKQDDTRPDGSVEGGGFSVIPDMMSLVGCSGEEFADILRTLGYRCQKRKIKPALASKKTANEETLIDEAPQAPVEKSTTPTDAISPSTEEPKAEASQASTPETVDDKVAPPAEITPSSETAPSGETETPQEVKPAVPTVLEVWLPGKKIPTNPKARRQHSKSAKGHKPAKKPNAKHKKPRPKQAPPKQKPDITNSPFAALKALRDDLKSADGS